MQIGATHVRATHASPLLPRDDDDWISIRDLENDLAGVTGFDRGDRGVEIGEGEPVRDDRRWSNSPERRNRVIWIHVSYILRPTTP